MFGNNIVISQLWDKQDIPTGKDWVTRFLKRNNHVALRKPEDLSRAREHGDE
jgi:hypothetical protein